MNFLSAVNPLLFIVLPIILVQYVYATFALVKLARARLSAGAYVLWNIFIVVGFFVGPTAYLVYSAVCKKKSKKETDKPQDGSDTRETEE